MITETDLEEYLAGIRKDVCSLCVERPPTGPPCKPLGKQCGVELHLAQLVDAVHQVHSDMIAPYLDTNRENICPTCPYHNNSTFCPCPMDSLAVLVVEAIEAVDRRREQRERGHRIVAGVRGYERPDMDDVTRAYEEATGTWTGCDWPTVFGTAGLDLEGWTAAEARAHAMQVDPSQRQAWEAAASCLGEVERRAEGAEEAAKQAIVAAGAGEWEAAAEHARRAWSLEFATGRPFRRQAPTWKKLHAVLAAAAQARLKEQEETARRFGIKVL